MEVLGGLVSAALQMVGAIVIVFCIITFFSLKPGSSKRFAFIGFSYFLSSLVALLGGAWWLMSLGSIHVMNLVGALVGAALVHLSYSVVLFILFITDILTER